MTVRWLRVAAEDLTRLLAAQPSRRAQRDFLLKLRQALAGIDTRAPPAKSGRVPGTYELTLPNWPYLIAYRRLRVDAVLILRLLPLRRRF
jgi:ParE toxin of type II toxin-antitoxin system, parDE